MKIVYGILGLVILQVITYVLFVKNENKKWSKNLIKFTRILLALAIAFLWLWLAFNNDFSTNILVRVVGAFAGLFIIYYIYNKVYGTE